MEQPWRVVLLGKTGAGKSSFGNTLLGENVFLVDDSANSQTRRCQAASKIDDEIKVIDTPGLFDNRKNEEHVKPQIMKSIIECSPGAHAFLIILKVERYTELEKQVITEIKEIFSEEVFKHAVLVFTHGDQLPENTSIKDFVSENKDLRKLSEKCAGRCHVVDNKYWKSNQLDPYRNNQFQVGELLNTIKGMVENGGGCYTNEMLQAVEGNIEQELLTAGSREKAKENLSKTLVKKMDGFSPDVLIKAFFGDKGAIAMVLRSGCLLGAAVGGAVGAVGGPVGAVLGAGLGAVVGAGLGAVVGTTVGAVVDVVGVAKAANKKI